MKRILIVEGLPSAGKSHIVGRLKEKFRNTTTDFFKLPLPVTSRKIHMHGGYPLNDDLVRALLDDLILLKMRIKRSHMENIVIERFLISTLISHSLIPSSSIVTVKIVSAYYKVLAELDLDVIEKGPIEVLCINVTHNTEMMQIILEGRPEKFYKQISDMIPMLKKFEKSSINVMRKCLCTKTKNLKREAAYKAAYKFLKGGSK